MKKLVCPMHCYRPFMPIITLRGAIVEGVISRKVADYIKIFPSNSIRLLMGSSKFDDTIYVDDIVRFMTHVTVSRAIKNHVMEAGPLGRPQRPRSAKRSGECDHDAAQTAVEGKKLCCGAKQNCH